MADRFWVGQTGNWSDNTNHWSTSDGGGAGASKPTSSDDVYFTANSFNGASQTVTVNEASICLAMDWTGATNTPTLAFSTNNLTVLGNVTFIAAMAITRGSGSKITLGGTGTLTTNGLSIAQNVSFSTASDITLGDNYTDGVGAWQWQINGGGFDSNGYTVTIGAIIMATATAKTITLGASTINCTSWNYNGSNLTLDAGTSTIKVTFTGVFTGGGLTYNKVELNGTDHTISGDNTFASLHIGTAGAATITFTDGSTQTVGSMTRVAGTDVKTLVGTSTGGWDLVKQGGIVVEMDYLAISYSTATAKKFYAGENSTDTVGNSGWIFTNYHRIRISPGSGAKIAIAPGASEKLAVY